MGRAIVSYKIVEAAVKEARQTPRRLPGSMELGASLEDDRITSITLRTKC